MQRVGFYAASPSRVAGPSQFAQNVSTLQGPANGPVSYTHLDVYKRQGYSQAKIAYRADAKSAREVYINSTVPDDLFQAYGFVVSTKAKPEDESRLIIGGTIDGKPVGNYEKTTVYETFKAAPIYERDYTAKDFNGGLPGYNNQGAGDGYVTYFYWMYMQLKDANGNFTTLSALSLIHI